MLRMARRGGRWLVALLVLFLVLFPAWRRIFRGTLSPLCVLIGFRRRRGALLAGSVDGVLFAASVGITLSPSASVVVLLMSDFLAYYY